MEKFVKPEMEIVEFDAQDVITTSGIDICAGNEPDSCVMFGPISPGSPD